MGFDAAMVAVGRVELRNVSTAARLSSLDGTSARLPVRMCTAAVGVRVSRFETGCFQASVIS